MSKMDPEIKARWVAALRSGEYKQTKHDLKNEGGHCCLGVLCDLFAREAGMREWDKTTLSEAVEETTRFLPDSGLLGAPVVIWSGLDCKSYVAIDGKMMTLYGHNDRGATFAEIADAIEAQL